MSRNFPHRFLALAVSTCIAGCLFAQGDTAGDTASSITGSTPAVEEAPRRLLQALAEWSGEATSLELLVVQDFPSLADAYVRGLEAGHGAIGEYFERHHPETTEAFTHATGLEAGAHGRELFDFVVTDPPAYAAWQAQLDAGSTLVDFVMARDPSILAELERVNLSPAAAGVRLMDFLAERGYEHLFGPAQSMIDKIAPPTLPPGSCACDVVVDFVSNPVTWSQVKDEHYYDGAPLPVIETRYSVEADGPAQEAVFRRRTKAKDFELERKDRSRQAVLSARLHCLEAGDPGGAYCRTGSCTAELMARSRYATEVSTFLDAGLGKAKVAAYNGARLLYNPGQASEQVLISHGVGVSGEKNTEWDVGGFVGPLLTLVKDIVVMVFTGFGGISTETVDNLTDGIVNLHHVDGADGSYASLMSLDRDVAGTMAANVTYTLQLDTESVFYGWGRLHAHTKTYAGVRSSFLMAAATHGFVCDAHVTPPERTIWWRYAAAPGAPEGKAFLRDQVREIALLQLNAALPNNAFSGETETSGEGSYQP